MKRLEFPGGWYCDALPSGEYAVLVKDSHVQTHQGRINLPAQGEAPLYLRITNIGGFQIAGQGFGPVTWWWTADHGWVRKPAAVGVSPVIFDNLGHLHISDGSVGSQGYRFVDGNGHIFTGDETYNSVAMGLSEWTEIGRGYFIGQSQDNNDSAWVWLDSGARKRLEPGPCRFIRATRSGNNVAIAIWKPRFGAVLYWLTLDELLALPLVNDTAPQPQPKPEPKPEPQPVPVDPRSIVPNLLADLKAIRAEYGEKVSADECVEMLARFCVIHPEFGLHPKGGGNHAKIPGTNTYVSPDYLKFKHATGIWGTDVFGSGPDSTIGEKNVATPAWSYSQPKGWHLVSDPQNFVEVPRNFPIPQPLPVPKPEPKPEPVPQPPSGDIEALRNEVAALSAQIALLEADHQKLSDQFMAAMHVVTGRIDDLLKPRTVEIDSSRVWGHSHKVTVTFP